MPRRHDHPSSAIRFGSIACLLLPLVLVAGGLLQACSDDAPPAAPVDAGAGDAEPDTAAADEDAGDAAPAIAWKTCLKGIECASVTVPLDYDNPSLGTIKLSLARSRATIAAKRLGVIFLNPGGPGAPAVEAFKAGTLPQMAGPGPRKRVTDQFDLIAMDPRGVGESTPVDCFEPAIVDAMLKMPGLPKSDADWTSLFNATSQVGPSCKAKNDPNLLARMDSASVAKDIDAVRALLGEEKINFLGFSYGCHLAAVYATLFPTRVRSFVLDSPSHLTADRRDRWRALPAAGDLALERFFDWCATSPKCAFGPTSGRTPAAIAAAYDALVATLDATPFSASPRPLDGAGVRYASLTYLYDPPGQWSTFGTVLADAAAGNGATLAKVAANSMAPTSAPMKNMYSAFMSVANADEPLPPGFTKNDLRAFIEGELSTLAPRLGVPTAVNELPYLLDWPIPAAHPPVLVDAKSAPPLLLLAGRYDPSSPYATIPALMTALGNGSHLVTYEGAGHTQSARSLCLADAAIDFLIDPNAAPKVTSCPGLAPN